MGNSAVKVSKETRVVKIEKGVFLDKIKNPPRKKPENRRGLKPLDSPLDNPLY